jgi:hypothetical protein
MSTFSLNASGFLGDVKAVEAFFGDLKALLSKPEYGVTTSQFTGLGKWETNFHQSPDAGEGDASGQAPQAEATAAGDGDGSAGAAPPASPESADVTGDSPASAST